MEPSPHDALFRYTWARPLQASGVLSGLLPRRLRAAMAWPSTMRWPDSHVDRRLRRHQADLIFRVRSRDGDRHAFFLVEHKVGPEPFVALQLRRYQLRIHEACRAERPRARTLPLVVTVLVSHGRDFGWPLEVEALVDPRWPGAAGRRPRGCVFHLDLARISERRLLAMRWPPLAKLTLLFLQFVPRRAGGEVAAALQRWAVPLRALGRTPTFRDDLEALSSYILETTTMQAEQLDQALGCLFGKAKRGTMITTGERIRRQARKAGRQEGRQQGRHEALAEVLRKLLRERFGRLDRATTTRIRKASAEELDRWTLAVLSARSLQELFAA